MLFRRGLLLKHTHGAHADTHTHAHGQVDCALVRVEDDGDGVSTRFRLHAGVFLFVVCMRNFLELFQHSGAVTNALLTTMLARSL